jgi:hypothetical protein
MYRCLFGRPVIGAARMASEAAKDSRRERHKDNERQRHRETARRQEREEGREGCQASGRADEGTADEGTSAGAAMLRPDMRCTENVVPICNAMMM